MAGYAGDLKFNTSLDSSGVQKGANNLKSIIAGLGIFEVLKKGLDMIVSTVGDAIDRVDTLERFPKVLQSMGFSADQASTATKKLSDGIQGLPTTLNSIISTAQSLTVLTGNLDLSTDAALALNNAFYASNATVADAERGMVQYSQMLAKGSVDIISWRTLQETMGYALRQTAEAFGYTGAAATTELYDALKAGDITFTEFTQKLIELDQAQGGFAEQAKTNTGGLKTSMTNARTAVVRGMADMVSAFNKSYNAGSVIEKLGKGVEKVMKGIAKNIDVVVPVVIAAGAAFMTWKVVQGVTKYFSGINAAIAAYTATQGLATAATQASTAELIKNGVVTAGQGVAIAAGNVIKAAAAAITTVFAGAEAGATITTITFSAALKAMGAAMYAALGPIGLILLAIVGLVALFAAIISAVNKSNAAYMESKADVEALAKAQDELDTSIEESTQAYKDEQAALKQKQLATQLAKDKLALLQTAQISAAGKALTLKTAVDDLNDAYENLNLTIEEYEANPSAAQKRIEEYTKLADSVSAYESQLSRQAVIEDEIAQAQTGLAQIESERLEIAAQLQAGLISIPQAAKLFLDLESTQKDYNETLEKSQVSLEALTDTFDDATYRQEKALLNRKDALNGATDSEGRNLQKLAESWGLTTDEILDAMDKSGKNISEWSADNAKFYTKDGKNLSQVAKQWGVTEAAIEKYIADMGSDLDGYIEHQESLFTESGMDLGLLAKKWGITAAEVEEACKEMGYTYDEYNEHMKATHTEEGLSLEQLAAKWGTTTEAITEAMAIQEISLQEWSDNQDATWTDFQDKIAGHTEGIINSFDEIPAKFDMTGDEMIKVLQKNRERYATWQQNMKAVSELVSQDTVNELMKLGPGANSAIEDLLANSGEGLLQFDAELKGAISDSVTNATNELNSPALPDAAGKLPTQMASGVAGNKDLTTAVGGIVPEAKTELDAQVASADFTSVGKSMADQVVEGVASSNLGGITEAIVAALRTGSPAIASALSTVDKTIQSNLSKTATTASTNARMMVQKISTAISSGTGLVSSAMTVVSNAITTVLNSLSLKVQSLSTQIMNQLSNGILNGQTRVVASTTTIVNSIITALSTLSTKVAPVIQNMFAGMSNAMSTYAGTLYAKADQIAAEIIRRLSKAFEVRSPSRVMFDLFANVMKGMLLGLDSEEETVFRKTDEIAGGILDRLSGLSATGLSSIFTSGIHAPVLATAGGYGGTGVPLSSDAPISQTIIIQGDIDDPDVFARKVGRINRYGSNGLAAGNVGE